MDNPIKQQLTEDMKSAMKAHDQKRLDVIRFILAAIKRLEVDSRTVLDEPQTLTILEKLAKQHRDSIEQFKNAGRDGLVAKETFGLEIVQSYLPETLSDAELAQLIQETIKESGATSIRDMGKVMGILKPKVQGRVDMGALSAKIKQLLS